jgi:hypothetical protein
VSRLFLLLIFLGPLLGTSLDRASAGARVSRPARSIARINFVRHGLVVRQPNGRTARGKAGQWLLPTSVLKTRGNQSAALQYTDRTLILMNEGTELDVRNSAETLLSAGEIEEVLTPGTRHDILAPVGLVHAIGTAFDVSYRSSVMRVTVAEGSAVVSDIFGSVVVETGQQSVVRPGSAPTAPTPAVTTAITRWTRTIPPPRTRPEVNVVLAANGGHIAGASSYRTSSPGHPGMFDAANVIDGRLDRGWQSGPGETANQFLIFSFPRSDQFTVTSVVLDCAATAGESSDNALKGFELRVSGDPTSMSSFKTVFSGTCRQRDGLQIFALTAPIMTRYLMLFCRSNWGGADGIALAEVEVVSPDRL